MREIPCPNIFCHLCPFFAFLVDLGHNFSEFLPPVLRPLADDDRVDVLRLEALDAVRVVLDFVVP